MSGRDPRVREAARRRGVRPLALLLLAPIALAAAALSPGAGIPPSPRAPYATSFPAGAGQAIAERACLICHSAMLVTQQAKDSTGWERTLAAMESWGAPLTPAEHDTLRGYLLVRYGPRGAGR